MGSKKEDATEEILNFAKSQGITLAGVADLNLLKDLPSFGGLRISDFERAISMAIALPSIAIEEISSDDPGILYAWSYKTANAFLDETALKVAAYIRAKGFKSQVIPASLRIDLQKQIGHVSHKAIAWAAGLGWIGRNGLLINPEFGSRIRLVTVLTDMPLKAGGPIENRCGDCRLCVQLCPSQALNYVPFNTRPATREEIFNPSKCAARLSKNKENFMKNPAIADVAVAICGYCIKVCPYGKANPKRL